MAMLQSVFEQKGTIMSILEEREALLNNRFRKTTATQAARTKLEKLPILSQNDFENLKKVCNILKPFDIATKLFSEEQSTASAILPALNNLKVHLQKIASRAPSKLVEDLISQIVVRYEKISNCNLLWFSTLLDPRFAYLSSLKFDWHHVEEDFSAYCLHGAYILVSSYCLHKIHEF